MNPTQSEQIADKITEPMEMALLTLAGGPMKIATSPTLGEIQSNTAMALERLGLSERQHTGTLNGYMEITDRGLVIANAMLNYDHECGDSATICGNCE